jgi:predicted alpha/beta superfamily hydrolase
MSEDGHTLTGDIRQHPNFPSQLLGNQRDVLVYLPPGYRRSLARYPVLYLHDGQNVFDAATAFGGVEWNVDETAQRLIKKRAIAPLIIVAVNNAGADRIHEYTPTRGHYEAFGERGSSKAWASRYGRFLFEELKPFIDKTYRTRPDAEDTGMGGSSLGGLVTMYLVLRFPGRVGRLAVMSPSVWWDDCAIYQLVEDLNRKPTAQIWLDTGTAEDGWERCRGLRDRLLAKGWQLGVDLKYHEAEGGEHTEAAWAMRMEGVLRYLFPGRKPKPKVGS